MKNKIDYRIIVIVVLVILLIVLGYFYFKDDSSTSTFDSNSSDSKSESTETNSTTTFTVTSSVSSALEEEIPLRTGYYFKEMLVEDNVVIKKGTKIIKYTNGNYLKAPYDLVITSVNLPETKKICNSSHSITVAAYNVLSAEFRVTESRLSSVYIGKTVKVKIPALNNKEVEGIVTDITSTATNGRFTATVEFDNDGDIKLGMTINITV